MILQIISNIPSISVKIYNRLNDILAPKLDAPTADELAQPLGQLVAPSADSHKFKLWPLDHLLIVFGYLVFGSFGSYVLLTQASLATIIYTLFMVVLSVLGLTAGAHRFWSHRAFKAKPPLEIFLTFLFLLANQRSIVTWVRYHRLHHQYADTDADPHNATRGFFFSHIWWLMVVPHPEVQKRAKLVDVSDLMSNPIIRFQEKYMFLLNLLVTHLLPTYIPTLWGESLYVSAMANLFRANMTLHSVSSINSVAHLMGTKPIDKTIVGTQYPLRPLLVGIMSLGDGFHNYHHTFPVDYRASEFGDTKYNLTAMFIELMAKIGLAYDLKVTSEDVVRNRVLKKGDGSDRHYLTDEARTNRNSTASSQDL